MPIPSRLGLHTSAEQDNPTQVFPLSCLLVVPGSNQVDKRNWLNREKENKRETYFSRKARLSPDWGFVSKGVFSAIP